MQKYIIVVLTLAGPTAADDFAHYYTPSGFRLPLMSQGEFVLSGSGYHYKSTGNTEAGGLI